MGLREKVLLTNQLLDNFLELTASHINQEAMYSKYKVRLAH